MILVDHTPLERGEVRPLFHKSLIQIADQLAFFLLPNEVADKKKRFLKEKRKELLDQVHLLHGGSKPHFGARDTSAVNGLSGLKGFGRRLNLKEMLMLHKYT